MTTWILAGGTGFLLGWFARILREQDQASDRRLKLPRGKK